MCGGRGRAVRAGPLRGAALAAVVRCVRDPWCLAALLSAPLAVPPSRQVLAGDNGLALIKALGAIGRLEFVYAVLITVGLVIGR